MNCYTYDVTVKNAATIISRGGHIVQVNAVFMDFYIPTIVILNFGYTVL